MRARNEKMICLKQTCGQQHINVNIEHKNEIHNVALFLEMIHCMIPKIHQSLFESTLLSFCKNQSKLDVPTLRQGSRERKNATPKKYDTRYYFNPGPRLIALILYPLSYGDSWQNLNPNPHKLFKSSTYSAALFPPCGL